MRHARIAAAIAVCLVAAASCASDPDDGAASVPTTGATTSPSSTTAKDVPTTISGADRYSATITRTEFDVPHIVADDWGSLGFGQGYAFAEDRACTLLDQVIKIRGERSKWFGPGDGDTNVDSDFAYRHLHLIDRSTNRFAGQPAYVRDMVAGYVAGFNQELADEGPSGWCAGAAWVGPITLDDFYAYLADALLYASSGSLIGPIANAQPPTADGTPSTTAAPLDAPTTTGSLGSNGWAIGSALSENGRGMLLANPHFPWEGEKRLWESQLTLTTGEMNAYGVSISGIPGVVIGFNDAVAWTHTVSAGYRMTLYALSLEPGDPTSYRYGTERRSMTSEDITIDVRGTDGSLTTTTRTMWSSHYGPLLQLAPGWTAATAYTMRDANIDNATTLTQFLEMDRARSMDEFVAAHRTANGLPWVNTIATSADGRAWYADTAATPNLSPAAIATWQAAVAGGGPAKAALDAGAILLDGSDPANEWVDDPSAVRPGILPFDEQPQLERDDFVFNANDSHWLANPAEPLTGYSPLTGPERVPQSPRTRMNAVLLTDPSVRGPDGKLSLDEMERAWLSERGILGEVLLPQVLAACDRRPTRAAAACGVLRGWDTHYQRTSRGAVLWREFMASFTDADLSDRGDLFADAFDPDDPIATPSVLGDDATILGHLADVAAKLTANGVALDVALGEVQYDARVHATGTDRIGLPGGNFYDGTVSIVDCCSDPSTLAPRGPENEPVDGLTIGDDGYPVTNGNSFVMMLEFTDAGPTAQAVLTYGQPDDPASADYTAQTVLYSEGKFRAIRFTPADIAADPTATTRTVTGSR